MFSLGLGLRGPCSHALNRPVSKAKDNLPRLYLRDFHVPTSVALQGSTEAKHHGYDYPSAALGIDGETR